MWPPPLNRWPVKHLSSANTDSPAMKKEKKNNDQILSSQLCLRLSFAQIFSYFFVLLFRCGRLFFFHFEKTAYRYIENKNVNVLAMNSIQTDTKYFRYVCLLHSVHTMQ